MLLSCLYEVYQLASYYEQDQTVYQTQGRLGRKQNRRNSCNLRGRNSVHCATPGEVNCKSLINTFDKISTSFALDSLHKIRVSWVKNQVSARSDAQICFLS